MNTNTDADRVKQLLAFVSEIERKSAMTFVADRIDWADNWHKVDGKLTTSIGFAPITISIVWCSNGWRFRSTGIDGSALDLITDIGTGGEV